MTGAGRGEEIRLSVMHQLVSANRSSIRYWKSSLFNPHEGEFTGKLEISQSLSNSPKGDNLGKLNRSNNNFSAGDAGEMNRNDSQFQSSFLQSSNNPNLRRDLEFKKISPEGEEAAEKNVITTRTTEFEYFKCLWPYLRLARLFGMCPVSKVGSTTLAILPPPSVQWLNILCAHSVHGLLFLNSAYLLVISFTVNASYPQQSVVEAVENFLYYAHCFLNGLFMSWRVDQLPGLLDLFKQVETMCNKYTKSGSESESSANLSTTSIFRTTHNNTNSSSNRKNAEKAGCLAKLCNTLVLITLICQLIINSLYFSSVAYRSNSTTIVTYLQSFNSELGNEWGSFCSGLIFWFGTLYCDMGWAFTDVLQSILCIVITCYYTRLNRALAGAGDLHHSLLEEMRSDHRQITGLLQACNNLFSPLFLLSYLGNAGYLFTRLYTGIHEDLNHPHWIVTVESVTAFLFQMTRILLPTWLAANLNEKAHDALTSVQSWPSSIDLPNSNFRLLVIGRFVSQLTACQVGISGCGYFIISKSFLVALISAFFTYEVIILQFQTYFHTIRISIHTAHCIYILHILLRQK